MSFGNRTLIAGANGMIVLSVPLLHGRDQKNPLGSVRISNRNKWQAQHWKTICSCYNRSPWFEHYRDDLGRIYQLPVDYLAEWNLACFDWIMKQFGWNGARSVRPSLVQEPGENTIADYRGRVTPRNYTQFESPVYHQVFEEKIGFLPNLSILDYLFCQGNRFSDQ